MVRSRSRLTRQAEAGALWQLKDRNFSQVTRELGIGCSTLRRITDEARRIEQDVRWKRKAQIPKKIFLIGGEELSGKARQKLDGLLEKYPSLKGFCWAKEKVRKLYRQESKEEAARVPDNLILNLRCEDDGELIRWGNTLKHWREPILNYFR